MDIGAEHNRASHALDQFDEAQIEVLSLINRYEAHKGVLLQKAEALGGIACYISGTLEMRVTRDAVDLADEGTVLRAEHLPVTIFSIQPVETPGLEPEFYLRGEALDGTLDYVKAKIGSNGVRLYLD